MSYNMPMIQMPTMSAQMGALGARARKTRTEWTKVVWVVATFVVALSLWPSARAADVPPNVFWSCMGCHGVSGLKNANPVYHVPKIVGQSGAYIKSALKAYQNGERVHPTMRANAISLSDQDIEAIVAWLTRQAELLNDG